jgi:hypothetical protein
MRDGQGLFAMQPVAAARSDKSNSVCRELRSNQDAPDEVPCSWGDYCRDRVARASPGVRIVKSLLVVFSGVLLLVSAWLGVGAEMRARKYFPLQFADELSSRYFMQYVLSNRTIPLEIRRRLAVSSALSMVAFAGFAAVAYLSNNPVIAVLLLLICGFGVANIVWQWRSARRFSY